MSLFCVSKHFYYDMLPHHLCVWRRCFACRWGLRVHGDSWRRGQQSHHFRQLETGESLHTLSFVSNCLNWLFMLRDLFLRKRGFDIPSTLFRKWKKPFVRFPWWVNYLCVFKRKESTVTCVCAAPYRKSSGAAALTVLELFEVLSFGKMEMTLLLTFTVFNSDLQETRKNLVEG